MIFVLTGPLAGRTIRLGNHQFVEGRLSVSGTGKEMEGARRVLSRSYQAYPEGSPELKTAQEKDRGLQRNFQKATDGGNPERVLGGVNRPTGEVQGAPANDGTAADTARSADGAAGLVSAGSGHEHTGVLPEQVTKIKKALDALDPTVDAQWAPDGAPSIEYLSAALADQGLTRKMVDIVWPEFNRELAAELRAF